MSRPRPCTGRSMLWLSASRLQALLSAYRTIFAVLLTVRTRSQVQEHGGMVRLAGMNTGNTSRRVEERGASTFLSIRRSDLRARVQEVAVSDEMSHLLDHVVSAELLPADDWSGTVSCRTRVPVPQHRHHGAALISLRPDRDADWALTAAVAVCVCSVSPLGHTSAPAFLQARSPGHVNVQASMDVQASQVLVIPL